MGPELLFQALVGLLEFQFFHCEFFFRGDIDAAVYFCDSDRRVFDHFAVVS